MLNHIFHRCVICKKRKGNMIQSQHLCNFKLNLRFLLAALVIKTLIISHNSFTKLDTLQAVDSHCNVSITSLTAFCLQNQRMKVKTNHVTIIRIFIHRVHQAWSITLNSSSCCWVVMKCYLFSSFLFASNVDALISWFKDFLCLKSFTVFANVRTSLYILYCTAVLGFLF